MIRKLAVVLLMLFGGASISQACENNKRDLLPSELSMMIPKTFGIEDVIRDHSFSRRSGDSIVVLLLLPVENLGINCDENRDGNRIFSVWIKTPKGWKEIERNSDVLWPVATAGVPQVSITANASNVTLHEFSSLQNESFGEDITFAYSESEKRFKVNNWKSIDHNRASQQNSSLNKLYEINQKKYREVSDDDGYEGEISYMDGICTMTIFEYPEPVVHEVCPVEKGDIYMSDLKLFQKPEPKILKKKK